MYSSAQLLLLAEQYYWPFLRLSALFLAAPVFGAASVPVRVRIILAATITALAMPMLPPMPSVDVLSAAGLMLAAQQVLIGLTMGFIVQLIFGAAVIAGQTIAMTIGLGFAMSVDPQNGVQVPVLSQFYVILATLIFVAVDAHLFLIEFLVHSFTLLPVGALALRDTFAMDVVLLGSSMFLTSLLLVMPAMTAVLLINIAFGVITRAAPQLNIFAVGFPITILAGFVFIFLSLPSVFPLLEHMFQGGLIEAFEVFR
ncbi:MAG: flagellar biosynthetic protein FliR [Halioglobus sp.]